jgi:predicted Zn-ribbon and HTH transcriptional regulator
MAAKPSQPPPERSSTVRAALRAALREGASTARELSVRVGVREKDLVEHLAHLARSGATRGERLVVEPASCLSCGYVFRDRARLSRPSACPSCRGTHIDPPAYRLSDVD